MLFGLGNLFYGITQIPTPSPSALTTTQSPSSSSTPSPSFPKTVSSQEVRPLLPPPSGSARLPYSLPGQKLIGRVLSVGWGNAQSDPGFGTSNDTTSVKAKIVNLIASVRTLMRSESGPLFAGFGIDEECQIGVMLIEGIVPLIAINTLVIAYELVLG